MRRITGGAGGDGDGVGVGTYELFCMRGRRAATALRRWLLQTRPPRLPYSKYRWVPANMWRHWIFHWRKGRKGS